MLLLECRPDLSHFGKLNATLNQIERSGRMESSVRKDMSAEPTPYIQTRPDTAVFRPRSGS